MEKRSTLLIAVFISGICSLVVEITGARLLAPYLGNTIYTWAAVIALVLASLSFGYYLGGIRADRYNDRKHFSSILLLAAIATTLIPFIGTALLPFTELLDLVFGSIVGAMILVPASVFYGMVSPYAIKLSTQKNNEGRGAGEIFAISTFGSIIGALATGFILVPNLPLTYIFVLAGILMLIASWIVHFRKENILDVFPFLAIALIAILFSQGTPIIGKVLYSGSSAYYNIQVVDFLSTNKSDNQSTYRLMFLDNAVSSGEKPNGEPIFNYVRTKSELYPFVGEVASALVIGVAGGTEVEELRRAFPNSSVDGVDIDAKAVWLGKEFFSLKEDSRTKIFIDDARRYLTKTPKQYDLAVIDAFRGDSIPSHLTTKEFLAELKTKMPQGGIVMVNLISAMNGSNSRLFAAMHSTYQSEFRNVIVIPLASNPSQVQNIVMVASDRDLESVRKALGSKAYDGALPNGMVLTDELNPIDTYAMH